MGASFMNFMFFCRPANCISVVLLNVVFLFVGKIKWWWWSLMTNWFPSVLWHCWFGHLACKNRPRNELLCVEWDVKPYTLTLLILSTGYQSSTGLNKYETACLTLKAIHLQTPTISIASLSITMKHLLSRHDLTPLFTLLFSHSSPNISVTPHTSISSFKTALKVHYF